MKFEIRKAKCGDAQALNEVRYAAWLTTYPNRKHRILASDIHDRFKKKVLVPEYLEKQNALFRSSKLGFGLFVATHNGKPVGFCRVQRYKRFNKVPGFYIAPGFQGKGIGTALWKKAYSFLNKNNNTFLTVATYNDRAVRFYTKLGFKDTGKRPVFKRGAMRNGAHIPVMEMKLARRTT